MKISHQFSLMIGGFVLIPILVLGISIGVRFSYADRFQNVPEWTEVSRYLGNINQEEWQNLQKLLEHRPPDIDMVLFSANYTVAFSTIADFHPGQLLSPAGLAEYMLVQTTNYRFILDRHPELHDAYMLGRFPRHSLPPGSIIHFLDDSTLFLAIFLIVIAIGVILVARKLTRSIMQLEKATHQVAAGNLDYSIQASGNDEIRSLAASVEHMRLALKEELLRRGRFVMGISHDLKSPLALARAHVEAIQDGVYEDEAERQHYFGITITKLDQLAGLIDDLIDFARLDNAIWQASLQDVRLAEFLNQFARGMAHDAEVFHKHFATQIDLTLDLTLALDPRLVQRILENLVNNALRHSAEDSHIILQARQADSDILIEVCNDGPAISPEALNQVFEPFYRASASRREPGMGIGLSTVKTLVEAHGWSISALSVPGETVFTIHIPWKTPQSFAS